MLYYSSSFTVGFKQKFFERYVLHDSTKHAHENWVALEQGDSDLQAFNDKFSAALQLIAIVPNGTPVDGASQVRQYLAVIRPAIRRKLLDFYNDSYKSNLPAVMLLAKHAEQLLTLSGKQNPASKRVAITSAKAKKKQKGQSSNTTAADTTPASDWNSTPTNLPVPINNVNKADVHHQDPAVEALPMGRAPARGGGRHGRGRDGGRHDRGRDGGRRGGRGGGRTIPGRGRAPYFNSWGRGNSQVSTPPDGLHITSATVTSIPHGCHPPPMPVVYGVSTLR